MNTAQDNEHQMLSNNIEHRYIKRVKEEVLSIDITELEDNKEFAFVHAKKTVVLKENESVTDNQNNKTDLQPNKTEEPIEAQEISGIIPTKVAKEALDLIFLNTALNYFSLDIPGGNKYDNKYYAVALTDEEVEKYQRTDPDLSGPSYPRRITQLPTPDKKIYFYNHAARQLVTVKKELIPRAIPVTFSIWHYDLEEISKLLSEHPYVLNFHKHNMDRYIDSLILLPNEEYTKFYQTPFEESKEYVLDVLKQVKQNLEEQNTQALTR